MDLSTNAELWYIYAKRKCQMTVIKLKSELLQQCSKLVDKRHERILNTINDIESSLKEESKNTSGDKHHTGRAMLQIERENAGRQLKEIEHVKQQLNRVIITDSSEVIRLGSLVYTNKGIFFISISVGSLWLDDISYLAVASNAPIGLQFLGKKAGDSFSFNKKVYKILDVA